MLLKPAADDSDRLSLSNPKSIAIWYRLRSALISAAPKDQWHRELVRGLPSVIGVLLVVEILLMLLLFLDATTATHMSNDMRFVVVYLSVVLLVYFALLGFSAASIDRMQRGDLEVITETKRDIALLQACGRNSKELEATLALLLHTHHHIQQQGPRVKICGVG